MYVPSVSTQPRRDRMSDQRRSSYQERDHEVIDYEMFRLPDTPQLRGPAPRTLAPGEYFTCVGAAQTFGCFCEKPYPTLLADRLSLPVLNFGLAGAGPRLFLGHQGMLRHVNAGRFAIVQVMSGRSEDNSLFDSGGGAYLTRRSDGERMEATSAYRELLATESLERIKEVVEETRRNWVKSFANLIEAIEVPVILFWFSQRSPDYDESYTERRLRPLFGKFPHLVNRAMIEQIRPASDEYVECISARGLPQRLFSRFTGEPDPVPRRPDVGGGRDGYNRYYPSPEMHVDAADALVEACRKYAGRSQEPSPAVHGGQPA
jgi:hypothetical protein